MSNPITFSSATPNTGLPLLIAGQAQKEFFVNQALSVLDALQPQAVNASQPLPPLDADEGDCFRVTAPAVQAWDGCEDHLAIRIGGGWHFVSPRSGMHVFDRTANQTLFFLSGWQIATTPIIPATGTVIDVEARTAIDQVIAALRDIGILPPVAA